jgi:hypothetical protein
MALRRGELDLTFLNDLTQDELSLARDLIRRNLLVKHTNIFQGVEALRDVEAAPILRKMLSEEDRSELAPGDIGRALEIKPGPRFR